MTIAEYIASQLYKQGVRHVFGIPGGPSIPYMEAFRSAGIEFILTSNEASAGIMADVMWRIRGIPGICHSTFGPGATNISTGAGGALLDRSAILVLTSEINDVMLKRTTQMNIDHQALFRPVTKATFRLSRHNAADTIDSALRICMEEYPGPVHIGLPDDVYVNEVQERPLDPGMEVSLKADEVFQVHGNAGRGERFFTNDIPRVISMLDRSRKPLLALGLTAARLGLQARITEFLDYYRIPAVLTPMAKGLVQEDHPSYAGVLFHSLSDYLDDIISECDLVIGIGYDPVEFNYESWLGNLPLVHFDTRESDLPSSGSIVQYAGPADEWFSLLRNLNRGSLADRNFALKSVRDEMMAVFNGFTNHFGPAAAIKILREELPRDVILTADVGSHLHLAGQFWDCSGQGRIIMTNGWSSMGFGIPAALAAQLALPDATVACLTGDGGFLMMAGELITARRYCLPVIIVVFSDGELNLIKVKQGWKEVQPYATSLYQGDLFGSDVFLGVRVITADTHETMRRAVIEALSVNEPVIINAVIDPEDYRWLIVRR
ncbi:MAG: thiamine pyrophosphate-binding protein [Bacteroidales bacterium]|nr:thiamine pyrophosphate-binding protein [Bacteroidales bacterium]